MARNKFDLTIANRIAFESFVVRDGRSGGDGGYHARAWERRKRGDLSKHMCVLAPSTFMSGI